MSPAATAQIDNRPFVGPALQIKTVKAYSDVAAGISDQLVKLFVLSVRIGEELIAIAPFSRIALSMQELRALLVFEFPHLHFVNNRLQRSCAA
jgi:hypothetical protein